MNSRQKKIQQLFLDHEKEVLKKLEENYADALFEINDRLAVLLGRDDADMQHVIYQVEYQKALKKQVESILETLHSNEFETVSEYLAKAYEDGFIGTMYDLQGQGVPLVIPIDQEQVVAAIQHETKLSEGLYAALGKDTKRLSKQIAGEISRGISNSATYGEIARNIASFSNIPKNNAMRIARTEAHRIQCKATADAQWKAKEKGADVVKQWDSFLDGKTRDSHRKLDGQIRELDEPFEVDGMAAMQPGDFGDPAEDCNCRCALLQRARWALGNDFTKWDKESGGLVEIKAKDYDSFKMKYAKEVERVRSRVQKMNDEDTLENIGKSSTIKSKWDNDLQPRGQLPHIDEDNLYSYVANELNISEEKAIEYTDSVMGFSDELFTDVRKYQRGETILSIDIEDAKSISESVEEYIQSAPRWNGGITYRGCTVSDEELASYQVGSIINGMGGTSSWTSTKSMAEGFATRNTSYGRPNTIIFECDTQSKGTGIRHLGVFEHEDEVLVSKESKYEIVRTQTDDEGFVHVFLKELQ